MSEFIDKIKDALIYFEDKKYKIGVHQIVRIDDMDGPSKMIYPLFKEIDTDDLITINIGYKVQIITPYEDVNHHPIKMKSYEEFVWFNNTLVVAIKRITDDISNIEIINSPNQADLFIPYKSFEICNVKSLTDMCKRFNSKNMGSNITPRMDMEGNLQLTLNKSSNKDDSDMIKLMENNFKIKKIINDPTIIDFGSKIIAELSLDELKNGKRTFSIYDR